MKSHVKSALAAIAAGVALAGCATYDYGYGYTYPQPSYGYDYGYGPSYYDYGPSYYAGPSVGLGFTYHDSDRGNYRRYDRDDDRDYDRYRRDNDYRRGDNDRQSQDPSPVGTQSLDSINVGQHREQQDDEHHIAARRCRRPLAGRRQCNDFSVGHFCLPKI